MKVIVTGTDGYIGVLLGSTLTSRGYRVIGVDTGFYRSGWLYNGVHLTSPCLGKDIRRLTSGDLSGFDAMVHLAALSNDPLGQQNPDMTHAINHRGSVRLARLCKEVGISRFIYASSCSVYGIGDEGYKTEDSEPNPQTDYAACQILVERDVAALADDNFSPTFLRNASAYGPSPRMRFDILLNNLAGLAWTTREIRLKSNGMAWRPLVHVQDACDAIACVLEAPRQVVHNQVFNVGSTEQNYLIRDIAGIVADVFPGCAMTLGEDDGDKRSYRVRFDKIHERLPAFSCRRTACMGARQLKEIFERVEMTPELFQTPSFTRLKQLQYLIKTGQLDDEFYWRYK